MRAESAAMSSASAGVKPGGNDVIKAAASAEARRRPPERVSASVRKYRSSVIARAERAGSKTCCSASSAASYAARYSPRRISPRMAAMASAIVVVDSKAGLAAEAGEGMRPGAVFNGCHRGFGLARPKLNRHDLTGLMPDSTHQAGGVFPSYAREDTETA